MVLVNAPEGWRPDGDPAGAAYSEGRVSADTETVVLFARSAVALRAGVAAAARSLGPKSTLWVAWPRRAAGHQSDLTEQTIRDVALPLGLVDVKVAALEADWSGLKLVWRLSNRAQVSKRG